MRTIRSTTLGATVAALAIVASGLSAIWVTGWFRIFAENRGFLQLVVAIPVALLVVGGCLSYLRLLTRAQMLWGMLPVVGLILWGIGALGPGYAAWPWVLPISAAVLAPWAIGVLVGSALGRNGPAFRAPKNKGSGRKHR